MGIKTRFHSFHESTSISAPLIGNLSRSEINAGRFAMSDTHCSDTFEFTLGSAWAFSYRIETLYAHAKLRPNVVDGDLRTTTYRTMYAIGAEYFGRRSELNAQARESDVLNIRGVGLPHQSPTNWPHVSYVTVLAISPEMSG